jgi:broad specificity phosphatase PhoE
MTFYIIRHAHKEQGNFYNPRLRHQDEPISQAGRADSLKLWSYLCDKQISAIYISGYQRTRQTIEFVAEQSGLAPIVDERLNEIDNGLIEGMTDEAIHELYPEVWRGFRERSKDFRFPGGETGEEVRKRISNFLEEKRKIHADENIVLVCHEGLIRLTACHILGLPVYARWNFQFDFCGIMEIAYQLELGTWKLIRFNQKVEK